MSLEMTFSITHAPFPNPGFVTGPFILSYFKQYCQYKEVEIVEFMKKVKYRLIDLGKSQKWLENEITEKTGLFVDSSYLNKIYRGERQAPKIVKAIQEILDIQDTPTE